jgi:hypothetical protein
MAIVASRLATTSLLTSFEWDEPGGEAVTRSAPIAGIADIARHRRDSEDQKPLTTKVTKEHGRGPRSLRQSGMTRRGVPLLHASGRGQHLVGFGADTDVLSEIGPANGAGGIHQELCRTRNVTAFRPAAFVQQVVAPDGFSLGIGQDREGIAGLAGQIARDCRRVHANGHRTHPGGLKLFQVFLDAS